MERVGRVCLVRVGRESRYKGEEDGPPPCQQSDICLLGFRHGVNNPTPTGWPCPEGWPHGG